MERPWIRPGRVADGEAPATAARVVAFFPNAALGNSTIQLLTMLGVPADRVGVVVPDRIEGGQGMVLSIDCHDSATAARVESTCRAQGGRIHHGRA